MPFDIKKWKEENKEKHQQQRREYAERNKDRIAKQQKAYREANKQAIRENSRQYYEEHREEILEKQRKIREENKEEILKRERIRSWKRQGLNETEEEIEEIHERYINTTHCDCCNIEFSLGNDINSKCMDHCHKTNKFRNILCKRCNNIRSHIDDRYNIVMKLMSM
jgi:hydroxylamine reductase (hybrid-cluster protein)